MVCMQELMAEVGKLRESAAEAQAAQQALRSKADKCAQEATAAQESRQVPLVPRSEAADHTPQAPAAASTDAERPALARNVT